MLATDVGVSRFVRSLFLLMLGGLAVPCHVFGQLSRSMEFVREESALPQETYEEAVRQFRDRAHHSLHQKTDLSAVTREGYEETAQTFRNVYSPIFQKTGDVLWIEASWDDTDWTVEAKLWPDWWREGPFLGNRHVRIPGGFARRLAGLDGLALTICHELGHHLGGAPKDMREDPAWRSVEGQADYWAASECLKDVFAERDNVGIVARLNVPQIVAERCDAAFPSPDESAICKRSALAAQDLARVFPAETHPDCSTPDSSVVESVFPDHPSAQCRLDTLFAGALRRPRPRCWFR